MFIICKESVRIELVTVYRPYISVRGVPTNPVPGVSTNPHGTNDIIDGSLRNRLFNKKYYYTYFVA